MATDAMLSSLGGRYFHGLFMQFAKKVEFTSFEAKVTPLSSPRYAVQCFTFVVVSTLSSKGLNIQK